MASESDEEKINTVPDTEDVSPGIVLRALHAYNMVLGMDMGEQRRALLQGIYTFSGHPAPADDRAEQLLARGPVASVQELPALTDDEMLTWVRVFGSEDLGLTLQSLLQSLTGLPAEVVPAPAPAPVSAAADGADVADEADAVSMVTTQGRWDVVFCAYDIVRRCHRLTLLRAGAWVESTPVAPDAEWAARDSDAEGLLSPLLDMPLPFDEQERMLESAAPFTTPACPEQEALIERLLQEHGPFDQLYLIALSQRLPNPSCVEQRFETREAGEQGRPQRLHRRYQYRPAGLGVSDVTTALSSRWDSLGQLQERGQEVPFRPMLLQPGPSSAVQMASGWQIRLGWQLRLVPLIDGPQLPVRIVSSASGRLQIQAQGRFQEQFSLGAGQVASVVEGGRCVLHSGAAQPEALSWPAGISLGAGDLSVLLGDIEVSLADARETLEQELRPVPNVTPQMDYTRRWSVSATTEDTQMLQGSLLVEQTARTRDARASSQVRAQAQASSDARCGLTLEIGEPALSVVFSEDPGPGQELASDGPVMRVWEHPAAGHIQLGDGPRWAIRWRVREQRRDISWSTPIDIVSSSAWGTSTERIHDPVNTSNHMAVVQVAASYWLEPQAMEE